MKARMTHAARGELANAIRSRYRDASARQSAEYWTSSLLHPAITRSPRSAFLTS